MQTFFGLPDIKDNRELTKKESQIITQSKRNLYKEIWDLSYYSNGAINWLTIYNMPTWVRHLNVKFLNDARKKEQKEAEGKSGNGKSIAMPPSLKRSSHRQK